MGHIKGSITGIANPVAAHQSFLSVQASDLKPTFRPLFLRLSWVGVGINNLIWWRADSLEISQSPVAIIRVAEVSPGSSLEPALRMDVKSGQKGESPSSYNNVFKRQQSLWEKRFNGFGEENRSGGVVDKTNKWLRMILWLACSYTQPACHNNEFRQRGIYAMGFWCLMLTPTPLI